MDYITGCLLLFCIIWVGGRSYFKRTLRQAQCLSLQTVRVKGQMDDGAPVVSHRLIHWHRYNEEAPSDLGILVVHNGALSHGSANEHDTLCETLSKQLHCATIQVGFTPPRSTASTRRNVLDAIAIIRHNGGRMGVIVFGSGAMPVMAAWETLIRSAQFVVMVNPVMTPSVARDHGLFTVALRSCTFKQLGGHPPKDEITPVLMTLHSDAVNKRCDIRDAFAKTFPDASVGEMAVTQATTDIKLVALVKRLERAHTTGCRV